MAQVDASSNLVLHPRLFKKEDWTMDRDIDDFIFGNEEPMCSDK